MRFLSFGFACALVLLPFRAIQGQEPGDPHPVAEASRLRDAREFGAAIALLRKHLEAHPADGEATRMLAQTLYWSGRPQDAEVVYEAALERQPGDTRLRLDFARMLMETRRPARARELLALMRHDEHAAAEAELLLGSMAYWEGDLSAAKRHFETVLRHTADHPEATRQLGEIRALAAPWVRFAGEFRHDDQPLDRLAGSAEAGWYLTPLHSLAVRVQPQRLTAGDADETLLGGEASLNGFWPQARLETEATLGVLGRSSAGEPQVTGRLGLGFRLPRHFTLRARVERAPYLWTRASLATPVITQSASALLDWNDPRGWIGQTGYVLQQYPDRNRIHTTYLWALAPVVRGPLADVKLGYGFNYQDAEESRFGSGPGSLVGRYDPYYTPQKLQVHSAAGAVALHPSRTVVLRTSGAYGIRAVEDAPVFPSTGAGTPSYYQRSFHPWNARAALTADFPGGVAASIHAEHFRTAFYAYSGAGVELTYRFAR